MCQSGQSGEKQPAIACRSQHDGTHLIRINFVAALGDIENVSVCECACLVRNAHACKTVVVVVVVMVVVAVVVVVVAIAIRPSGILISRRGFDNTRTECAYTILHTDCG